MNLEDFKEKLKLIKSEFEAKEIRLINEYVLSNSPYNIGDIVTDHIGSIKVEKLTSSKKWSSYDYEAVYYGVELKKDGTPTKKGQKRYVYQSNLI